MSSRTENQKPRALLVDDDDTVIDYVSQALASGASAYLIKPLIGKCWGRRSVLRHEHETRALMRLAGRFVSVRRVDAGVCIF